ncbi:MAG: hypothetical protein EBY28_15265 [Betaproteobacteria bacterium]|nr:hypothetical protein [Betaproteobacteria bacterium]
MHHQAQPLLHSPLPPPPALLPMTQVFCQVGTLVSLGVGPHGERRYLSGNCRGDSPGLAP